MNDPEPNVGIAAGVAEAAGGAAAEAGGAAGEPNENVAVGAGAVKCGIANVFNPFPSFAVFNWHLSILAKILTGTSCST